MHMLQEQSEICSVIQKCSAEFSASEKEASFLRQVFLQVAIVPISAEMARKMTVFPSA
jgi:hypothetical protein